MNNDSGRRVKPTHYLSSDGRVIDPRHTSIAVRVVRALLVLSCLAAVAGASTLGLFLWMQGRTPREWAPYLQHRAMRHRPAITEATDLVAAWLIHADRLALAGPARLPALLGASANRSGSPPPGPVRTVASAQALRDAVANARPGDVIELQPGRYRFQYPAVMFTQPGTAAAPITLRATRLGDVVIESDLVETFKVAAPFWHFENLEMHGICTDHTYCEHALHIVGAASDTVIRNSRFEDYNAEIKINGEDGHWPDNGLIEGSTLTETAPRDTYNSISLIDLVGASGWRVSGNIITDFARGPDGAATYGAYFKGDGQNNVFERNLVVCERKIRPPSGQRIGLSLGGGGTDLSLRRDRGHSGFEQVGGVISDNLIAFCSDDGIYLNRAARSVIDHNTLLDTAGIDARFLETSATVTVNIVDGAIRGRDGGTVKGWDNDYPVLLGLFVGWHPQRDYYRDPAALDLIWQDAPRPVPDAIERADLCGRPRTGESRPGAFQDYAACGADR